MNGKFKIENNLISEETMLILEVNINVKPDQVDAFITATIQNCQNSRKEAGVLRFELYQDAENPAHFTLLEVYRDAAAQASHKQTGHYEQWRLAAEPLMSEPRRRTLYKNISPSDAEWN